MRNPPPAARRLESRPPQQPALFDLKDDSRPAWEHNAAPSLLAWLQVYGSCSGSTQPHL
jgi:hypothetical protein